MKLRTYLKFESILICQCFVDLSPYYQTADLTNQSLSSYTSYNPGAVGNSLYSNNYASNDYTGSSNSNQCWPPPTHNSQFPSSEIADLSLSSSTSARTMTNEMANTNESGGSSSNSTSKQQIPNSSNDSYNNTSEFENSSSYMSNQTNSTAAGQSYYYDSAYESALPISSMWQSGAIVTSGEASSSLASTIDSLPLPTSSSSPSLLLSNIYPTLNAQTPPVVPANNIGLNEGYFNNNYFKLAKTAAFGGLNGGQAVSAQTNRHKLKSLPSAKSQSDGSNGGGIVAEKHTTVVVVKRKTFENIKNGKSTTSKY
jgi:hypothetical protein